MSESGIGRSTRRRLSSPERFQHDFYTATAADYHETMAGGDEHDVALDLISVFISGFGYESLLDVGAGTGRGVCHFLEQHDGLVVRGVEPVRAMIDQAERANQIPEGSIVEGSGYELPFPDASFDVVCEFGVLHHVSEPNSIVEEMIRVARRAVFLSDANRFGGGPRLWRGAKYGLYRLGLWPLIYRIANRGRPFHIDMGDGGVVYSYSVYDSLSRVNDWADRAFIVPTGVAPTTWFHPLFATRNLLLCALREG